MTGIPDRKRVCGGGAVLGSQSPLLGRTLSLASHEGWDTVGAGAQGLCSMSREGHGPRALLVHLSGQPEAPQVATTVPSFIEKLLHHLH